MSVDWTIPPQTRESANQRFTARLASIFAQKQADAKNPALDKLRALNAEREAERREQHENIAEGMVEAREACRLHWANKRRAAR